MADILVHSALKEVGRALTVGNLGITEADIKTVVDSAILNNTFTSFNKKYDLERLSCVTQLSHCLCNYAGAGTPGVVGGSLWGCMANINTSSGGLYAKLAATSQMTALAQTINAYESTTLRNNLIQYIELYATKVINASSTANKTYWLSGVAQSMKVCSTNYNAGEGATCTWTVPAGATKAKFQVWGAGAGSNPGCCCSGAPFAANGAYAELVVGVTAGQQYVICAGCSCAINCCSNSPPGYACISGVTGPSICCLKADGGNTNNCCSMHCASTLIGYYTCQGFGNFYCNTSSGGCWCQYGEYCVGGGSCASCGVIAVHPNCAGACGTWCACGTDTKQIYKDGYRSLHGGGCFDTNQYGYMTRPPILDANTCLKYTGGCDCGVFTSGACCGGCFGDSWDRHPGMGGAYTHVMGGANQHYGGKGTGGMVKVSWE